jgi:hypothetical protein
LAILNFALLLPGAGCAERMPMNEYSNCDREVISIDLPPELTRSTIFSQKDLTDWSKDILCTLFPVDLVHSRSARGLLLLAEKVDSRHIFDLETVFLYRDSYTAVTHRVRFAVKKDAWEILSVD